MNVFQNAGGSSRIVYPDPVFDLGEMGFFNVRRTFKWCLRFFTHPIIFAALTKYASYPITELIYTPKSNNPNADIEARQLFDDRLKLRQFLLMMGLDDAVFGNAYCSLRYPFIKFLKCPKCGTSKRATEFKYEYINHRFEITRCPICKGNGVGKANDIYVRTAEGLGLIRWSPEDVTIEHYPMLPEGKNNRFFVNIPTKLKNSVMLGKQHVIEELPNSILLAIKKNVKIEIDPSNIYHMKRPSPSKGRFEDGLGIPVIMPVLQNAFLLNLLFKAEETIALDHIQPFRALFPNIPPGAPLQGSGVSRDVATSRIEEEIEKWLRNHNHISAFSFPVGETMIGGRGKALLLAPEIQAHAELILVGMGFPREWVFGGLSFAGSSVSHRMLENSLLSYREDLHGCANFVTSRVSQYLRMADVSTELRKFRMADDLNRAQYDLGLHREGRLSAKTLLDDREYDHRKENRQIREEVRENANILELQRTLMAEIEGQVSSIQARWQAKVQRTQAKSQVEVQQILSAAQGAPPDEQVAQQQQVAPNEQPVLQAQPGVQPETISQQALPMQPTQPPPYQQAPVQPLPQPPLPPAPVVSAASLTDKVLRMAAQERQAYLREMVYSNPQLAKQILEAISSREAAGWASTIPPTEPPILQ